MLVESILLASAQIGKSAVNAESVSEENVPVLGVVPPIGPGAVRSTFAPDWIFVQLQVVAWVTLE